MNIGAFGENFPYTNFHDLNMDWIIQTIKNLNEKFDKAINSKIEFADPLQWDITKQYESLTLVVDNNNAYLSMKPVPAGIAITNPDYWQNVFDMSGIYEMIEDLKDEMETNNSTRHLLYLGDSYSTYYSGKLFTEVVSRIGIPASQCHNVAVSGSSFSDPSNSFISQLQNYSGDKNEITDILVVGGINDAVASYVTSASALQTAIEAFASYAEQNYPNAKVHIAYVGGCLPSSSMYSVHPARAQEWALWGYTTVARTLNFRVLHTWNAIHDSIYNYNADGIHPSQDYGITVISSAIANTFNNEEVIINRPTVVLQVTGSGVNISNFSCFILTINDMSEISAPPSALRIIAGQSIDADNWAEIGNMQNAQFMIRKTTYIDTTVAIRGFNNDNSTKIVPAMIMFENGKMYIRIYLLNNEGTWQTLTAGSNAYITLIGGLPQVQVPIWDIN